MTRRQADYRLATGLWIRVLGRGLAVAGAQISPLEQAFAAHVTWPDAIVIGPSALRYWEWLLPAPSGPFHVWVPRRRRPCPDLVGHRWPQRPTVAMGTGQLKVQNRQDAVADSLRLLPAADAEGLTSLLLARQKIRREEMPGRVQTARWRPGVRQLRALGDRAAAGAGSVLEWDAQRLIAKNTAEPFLANHPITVDGVIAAAADLYHERSRTVVFLDGQAYHATADAFERDRRLDALLTAAGYRPIRFTWNDVHERAGQTVHRLLAAIALPPPGRAAKDNPKAANPLRRARQAGCRGTGEDKSR
jgi:hypothetical protein